MKTPLLALLAFGLLAPLASSAVDAPIMPPSAEAARRTAAQLDELLGPVALFPDSLVALILPAAANATDIVLASRYLDNGGDPDKLGQQSWAESVRALAHYPQVIDWLDEHLDWTTELGAAFALQPVDVMEAIQRLRGLARAAGTLVDTAEQRVVVQDGKILIVPTQTNRIYIPTYDPAVVYVSSVHRRHEPWITFGLGFSIGSWLSYDCDWWGSRVWIGDCYRPWHEHRPWRQPHYVPHIGVGHPPPWRHWSPPSDHHRRFAGPRPPWHGVIGRPVPTFPRHLEPWKPVPHRHRSDAVAQKPRHSTGTPEARPDAFATKPNGAERTRRHSESGTKSNPVPNGARRGPEAQPPPSESSRPGLRTGRPPPAVQVERPAAPTQPPTSRPEPRIRAEGNQPRPPSSAPSVTRPSPMGMDRAPRGEAPTPRAHHQAPLEPRPSAPEPRSHYQAPSTPPPSAPVYHSAPAPASPPAESRSEGPRSSRPSNDRNDR